MKFTLIFVNISSEKMFIWYSRGNVGSCVEQRLCSVHGALCKTPATMDNVFLHKLGYGGSSESVLAVIQFSH